MHCCRYLPGQTPHVPNTVAHTTMSEPHSASSSQHTAAPASVGSFRPVSLTGASFWPTMRKVAVMAASVDVLYFLLFISLGVPQLAWPNVSSVLLYAMVYVLILRRVNRLAMVLMWIEVLLHTTVGTLMIGWDSGFHYYLLLFIPAIGIGSSVRVASILLPTLLTCYLALNMLSLFAGPTTPLPETALVIVRWFNIIMVFAILSCSAILFRRRVQNTQERLSYLATHDPVTGLWNRRQFMAMAEHELARQRRTRSPLSIVVIDIHASNPAGAPHIRRVGDSALVHVAHSLRNSCRIDDIVARWDASEFVALVSCAALPEATLFAERARSAIEAAMANAPSHAASFSVSTGVTEIEVGEDFFTALGRADAAADASKPGRADQVSRRGGAASHSCNSTVLFAARRS